MKITVLATIATTLHITHNKKEREKGHKDNQAMTLDRYFVLPARELS